MKIFIQLALLFLCSVALSAPSEVCPSGEHKVSAHKRRAYHRADGTFVKAAAIASHCRKNHESDNYWRNKFIDTRPMSWPHEKEKSKSWSVEETERVLEGICELPEELWSKSESKIYRMEKSKYDPNPATSAMGIMVLYNSAFEDKKRLSRILAHEFAHEIYDRLKESDSIDYRSTTNWFVSRIKGRTVMISRKDGFVSDDGRVSPEEDFANNVEFYLFEPETLKVKTPHAFRWIKQHFGDKFSIRSCK